jgi:hypothetical protein
VIDAIDAPPLSRPVKLAIDAMDQKDWSYHFQSTRTEFIWSRVASCFAYKHGLRLSVFGNFSGRAWSGWVGRFEQIITFYIALLRVKLILACRKGVKRGNFKVSSRLRLRIEMNKLTWGLSQLQKGTIMIDIMSYLMTGLVHTPSTFGCKMLQYISRID